MHDVAWIGPRAFRHEQVIERVMQQSPVLPVHLGTLFSSDAAVQEFLRSQYFRISDFLDRVSGKEEWSVRVLVDHATAKERLALEDDGLSVNSSALSPGIRYLLLREKQASNEDALTHWLARTTQEILLQIHAVAEDFYDRAVLDSGDLPSGQRIVFNWSFLVSKDVLREFHECVQKINAKVLAHGLCLQAVGPWPPYSFTPKWNIDPTE